MVLRIWAGGGACVKVVDGFVCDEMRANEDVRGPRVVWGCGWV